MLDGDIDAVWIESMNTVMDDNKVLTLISNERVPLSPAMRMVFEISYSCHSLESWNYVYQRNGSWLEAVHGDVGPEEIQRYRKHISSCYHYVDDLVEMTRRGYKKVTSLRLINKVSTIVYLLEEMLPLIPEEKMTAEIIVMTFAYCATSVGIWRTTDC